MANMSYCRFENTVNDLRDCKEALDDIYNNVSEVNEEEVRKQLSDSERAAAKRLFSLCQQIVDEHSEILELL